LHDELNLNERYKKYQNQKSDNLIDLKLNQPKDANEELSYTKLEDLQPKVKSKSQFNNYNSDKTIQQNSNFNPISHDSNEISSNSLKNDPITLNLTTESSINLNNPTPLNSSSLPTKVIKPIVDNLLFSPEDRNFSSLNLISNQSIERKEEFNLFKTNDNENNSNPRNSNLNEIDDKQISSDIRPTLNDLDKMRGK